MMESINANVLLLQETIRETSVLLWNLSFPGCQVFEQGFEKNTYGARGLAIVVKSKFAVESVGSPAPNWIFARVFGSSLPNPVIVGSVYIPHTRKSEFLRDLAVVIKGLHARYPETPIILGGNWNCKLNVITRWIQTNELNADSFRGQVCSPVNHYPQWMCLTILIFPAS